MSDVILTSENQGGDTGGIVSNLDSPKVCGRGEVKHLTRGELRLLQRAAKRYPLTDADAHQAVECIREVMGSAEDMRTRVRAVEVQISMRESDRAEELHALEMEERLRALESEAPTQPAQTPGITIVNNQQVISAHPMMGRMQAIFAQDQPKDEEPPKE